MRILTIYIAMLLLGLLCFACSKDDAPAPEGQQIIDPDTPEDAIDPNQNQDESVDYLALKALYEANDGNTLGWNLDDKTMQSWDGVEQENERVTELKIQAKGIKTLVPEIGNLEKLVIINASQNVLTTVPIELSNLGELNQLLLRENELTDLPEGSLPESLSILGLAENKLDQLPLSFQNLKVLDTLNLSKNLFEVIPKEMGDLENLKVLNYSENLIEEVPEELGKLTGLTYLGLENNDITLIPQEVCNLEEDGITTIAKDARVRCDLVAYHYKALVALYEANPGNSLGWDLTDTSMQSWAGLTFFTNGAVSELRFGFKGIRIIPKEIGDLKGLKKFDFGDSAITSIAPEIGNLTSLEVLSAPYSHIKELPPEIGKLSNLRMLNFMYNDLESVPEEFSQLKKLEDLYLDNNLLSAIPDSFVDLINLRSISLGSNEFKKVPEELAKIPNLQFVGFEDNPLAFQLSPELCNLNKLGILSLDATQQATSGCPTP